MIRSIKKLITGLAIIGSLHATAQENTLMQQLKAMADEDDPVKSTAIMKKIIKDNKLDKDKDAETFDMMKGNVAMDYLGAGDYAGFDKMIASMNNKFNQTSFLSMAAATLVEEKKDLDVAESLAKRTLDLYMSFKDDPKAKPESFEAQDWKRFMDFAYYPYNDTYAMALYANGKYKEALEYQEKAFDSSPEEGMLPSVERYAHLLELNEQEEDAYLLLLKMARTGKSTSAMNKQLKGLYVKKNGDESGFDEFFTDLQKNVVATLKEELKKKILDVDVASFTLKDIDGKTVSLDDFSGKTVVIDFWATWCAPCKASFPAMVKVMDRHPEVKFLYIATQEKQDGALSRVRKYINESKYPFHVLMDEPVNDDEQSFKVLSMFKPRGIPAKVIIDGKGKQLFMSTGFSSDTELINELEAMIQLAAERANQTANAE